MQKLKSLLMKRLIWDQQSPRRIANRLNAYCSVRGRNIQIDWQESTRTFVVSRGNDLPVHVARVMRLKEKWSHGNDRLKELYEKYLLSFLSFSADDIVIDVGANIGELSLYLQRNFSVMPVCCEPDPTEQRCLEANFMDTEHILIKDALWNEPGEAELSLGNDKGDSSLILGKTSLPSIPVRRTTLDLVYSETLAPKGVDRIRLLKLEAEGAEPEILQGAEGTLDKIDYIAADLGPERGPERQNTVVECVNYLLMRNFKLLKVNPKQSVYLFASTTRTS